MATKNITDEKKRLFDKRQDIDFEISKWELVEFGNLDWLISPKELN